jgi:hypothetical protein
MKYMPVTLPRDSLPPLRPRPRDRHWSSPRKIHPPASSSHREKGPDPLRPIAERQVIRLADRESGAAGADDRPAALVGVGAVCLSGCPATGIPSRPGLPWRLQAVAGGRVTDSSGGVPRYASTSTSANCPVHPWLRLEDGRSAVSTLGFP